METAPINHGDILDCYGIDYEIVLVLGKQVTIRCTVPNKKGKYLTVNTDINMIINHIQEGNYKLKTKVADHGKR